MCVVFLKFSWNEECRVTFNGLHFVWLVKHLFKRLMSSLFYTHSSAKQNSICRPRTTSLQNCISSPNTSQLQTWAAAAPKHHALYSSSLLPYLNEPRGGARRRVWIKSISGVIQSCLQTWFPLGASTKPSQPGGWKTFRKSGLMDLLLPSDLHRKGGGIRFRLFLPELSGGGWGYFSLEDLRRKRAHKSKVLFILMVLLRNVLT